MYNKHAHPTHSLKAYTGSEISAQKLSNYIYKSIMTMNYVHPKPLQKENTNYIADTAC